MSAFLNSVVLACGLGGVCWAARCTTVADPVVLRGYQDYVAAAEQKMSSRFDSAELSWVPDSAAREAAARLASGRLVRWNISDAALNRRIAGQNGTVIHWIGAIRIPGASLTDLQAVLQDYDRYDRIYQPMVFECKAQRDGGGPYTGYEAILGLHSTFRFASLFPQHYAFRVKVRIVHSAGTSLPAASAWLVHLKASEIRESDSGVPGRTDLLEPFRDHGIMWALNAYWRARQRGTGLYLEFETITLARSVQAFACKIGFVPVPKSIVSAAMDSIPEDSVRVILEGTKAECERRAMRPRASVSGQ
ncbi:MAG: hypothetical protein NTW28_07255 [Candidatus Solibacter sp.]|nr:hypothetical protein [Candidatus Solibacter sp.]